MNVSLQKLFYGLLLMLAIPLSGWSQDVVNLETYRGVQISYEYVSFPYNASVVKRPLNGTFSITSLGNNRYRITYRPNAGFVGKDQIQLYLWQGATNPWLSRTLNITVLPSNVDARPDLVLTYRDVPLEIDVLKNDITSTGNLTLKSILLVNNGTAAIVAGQKVNFTPASGFTGIAQLNYTVCDEFDICDQGTVSVNVVDNSTAQPDTLRLFAKKNKPQSILVPKEFAVRVAPVHGVYSTDGELPTYTPGANFVGKDYLELSQGDMVKVVEITVLDVVDNLFAFNDEVYTTVNESVEFNVLENDAHGMSAGCFAFSQPEFGQVKSNSFPTGSLTYSPPRGFQGLDKFTYTSKIPGCGGQTETATVYIYVSNFEPAYTKFKMVTPKRTPLIIAYNVPITGFEFKITDQAELGTARFLRGRVDTTIYGQRIRGNNVIVYIPGDLINSGTDEFEIEYCVNKTGKCQFRKVIKIEVDILDVGEGSEPMCFSDCIWPGDANADGIVNMTDLLPLGLYMGKVGLPREDANLSLWYGQYGANWSAPNGSALKHIDTDGDSLITGFDTLAISRFYGRTHSLVPAPLPNYKHTIELHGDIYANPGDLIELDMILGAEENPAVNVYGFTFPFEYNPDFFRPSSVQINYTGSSWLAYGSPILAMSKNDLQGLIESGFTRTNGISATGRGRIGKVRIVVEDNIAGFRPDEEEIDVELGGGVATVADGSGQTFGAQIGKITIRINLKGKDETQLDKPELARELLKVFPNPTADFLQVHLNGGHEFKRVQLFNLAGQQVHDSGSLLTRSHRLNVANLPVGIYVLSVQTDRGLIREKVEIMR